MKKQYFLFLVLLLGINIFAQDVKPQKIGEDQWKHIDSLLKLRMEKSADLIIDQIYEKSKRGNNIEDFVHSLFYKAKQNNKTTFIAELENEIQNSNTPRKQILHSVIAETYVQYYKNYRWEINERTKILQDSSLKLGEWSKNDFFENISRHFRSSLQDADTLQKVFFSDNSIIIEDSTLAGYNPSLFEMLAFRAIQSLTDFENEIDNYGLEYRPKPPAFLLFSEFFKHKLKELEKPDFRYQVLQIYQTLLNYQFQKQDTAAFVYSDLMRLKFTKDVFYKSEKYDRPYLDVLEKMTKAFEHQETVVKIYYEIAQTYLNRGQKFDPYEHPEYQWELKKSIDFAQKAIQKFPSSKDAEACRDLIKSIKKPLIEIVLRPVNLPENPILASLTYQNLDRIYFKLIPTGILNYNDEYDQMQGKAKIDALKSFPVFDEWKQELPNENDHQSHNVQFRITDVPTGNYLLLSSSSPAFDSLSIVNLSRFAATNIGFVQRKDGNRATDIFVLNRLTGLPMKGVKLEIQTSKNVNGYDHKWKTEKTFISDKNGYIRIAKIIEHNNFDFLFSYKNDTLIKRNIYLGEEPLDISQNYFRTSFFTDRSIYRPGQTIHFKGIIYQKQGDHFIISHDKNTIVKLFDVNRKEIKKLNLKTNEFGSFHASFTIPANLLNGVFSIGNESGQAVFSVEEYKSPTFEIVFDTIRSQFRLNDSVCVTGTIKAFSGYPISGANLKYKISRYNLSPFIKEIRQPDEQQLAFGALKSDESGRFQITFFAAEADEFMGLPNQEYQFKIELTSVDISGETQTAIYPIRLGSPNLKIICDWPDQVDNDIAQLIPVKVQNLYDVPQDVNIVASVYKLKQPTRIFKERKWKRPDRFVTDRETFYTYFPDEQFDDEKNLKNLDIDYQVYQAEINTGELEGFELFDLKNWALGYYKLVLRTQDQFDEEAVREQYFTLYNSKTAIMPVPEIDWFVLEKNEIGINDSLKFIIGSATKKLNVLYEIQQNNKVILSKWITLKNEQQKIKIPAAKMNGKNFDLNLLFVNNNEAYFHKESIKVYDPSKDLEIKLETFRSIIQPKSTEVWKLKINNKAGNKTQAELLACMFDASLEKIKPNNWNFSIPDLSYNFISWNTYYGFQMNQRTFGNNRYSLNYRPQLNSRLPYFKWDYRTISRYVNVSLKAGKSESFMSQVSNEMPDITAQNDGLLNDAKPRKNFNKTAFFYPDLKTDVNGNINIKFTSPESLTRWKFMTLAHTIDLKVAQLTENIITQKELMISPDIPRFFREGDTIYFSTKIISLSNVKLSGDVSLQFFDANNMKPMKGILLENSVQTFEVSANSSISKHWKIYIPSGLNAVVYRLTASSKNHRDGEERIIPVLSNKILVTESLPIHLNPQEAKKLVFQNLLNSAKNRSLVHQYLKLEMTTNPAWYAMLALPKISEGNKTDAISSFNCYYSNSMANYLLHAQPQIKQIFDIWKVEKSGALTSQLEKNPELKPVLLEETPWMFDAKNESEQRKTLALFFDQNQVNHELSKNLDKLLENQLVDGSWSWFKGMRANRYVTQHIVNGLVRLQSKKIPDQNSIQKIKKPLTKAIQYLNGKLLEDYQNLKNNEKIIFGNDHLGNLQIQYLFTLSFLNTFKEDDENFKNALAYFFSQEQNFWMHKTAYLQGMIALTLFRTGDTETAKLILKSLKERSIRDKGLGTYWVNDLAYYWYQAPIETQALLIEAFSEIENDQSFITELKKWLIYQKQTQMWSNPKASVEAVNALLLNGGNLLKNQAPIQINIGKRKIESSTQEAGTGFCVQVWQGNEINANMGNIELKNENSQMAFGVLHWQYFEQLDSIISKSEGPLKIEKKLFIKKTDKTGSSLIPITEQKIKIGDKVVSRIVVQLDRDMEFVHINDMRASAFEPIQVLSGYRYQSGVGFYQTASDLAIHYYFDKLGKGIYVFENEMFVTQKGTFSNGISSIQCLYAPEFSSHSKNLKLIIE